MVSNTKSDYQQRDLTLLSRELELDLNPSALCPDALADAKLISLGNPLGLPSALTQFLNAVCKQDLI